MVLIPGSRMGPPPRSFAADERNRCLTLKAPYLLGLHTRCGLIGSLSRPRRPLPRRLLPCRYPAESLVSYHQSTALRVESSSTNDSRPRGARPITDTHGRAARYGLTRAGPLPATLCL